MNKVILMGRLTRSPEVRYSQGAEPVAVAIHAGGQPQIQAKGRAGGGLHSLRCLRQERRICGEIFPEGAAGRCDGTAAGAQLGQGRRKTLDDRGYH